MERFLVSVLHAHNRRAGNCIGLFSNTVLLHSTDSKLLVLYQYQLIPGDSLPLPMSQFSRFWRRIFVIEVSDLFLLFTIVFNF